MNEFERLERNPFIDKRLCMNYIKSKFQTEIDRTIGNKGICYEVFSNKIEEYSKVSWVDNMLKFYENEQYKNMTQDAKLRRIYALYYGSVNIFKPSVAKYVCDRFRPFSVLDPFAGWGSRMLGAMASSSVMKYTGIDNNKNLKQGYDEMREELRLSNLTEIIYDDCLNIDYSKHTYDMVLTSPPYYNLELYSNTQKKSKQEWNEFYREIFKKVFDNLQMDGYFCININTEIYEKVLEPMLGKPLDMIEYPKSYRRLQRKNPEYIYIFQKSRFPNLP